MLTPGPVTAGSTACVQLDGPRLLAGSTWSPPSTEPTASASGRFAGARTEPGVGPPLPAAKTGTTPAARSARRSGWNSRLQPDVDIVQESLTTFGASAVAGLRSGSSSHW